MTAQSSPPTPSPLSLGEEAGDGETSRRQPRLLTAKDPFRRTSALFLILIGLVVIYTLVLIGMSDQPAALRGLGAASLVLLFWVWVRIHQDDSDLMWATPFEAAAMIVIGLGVGDTLLILAVFYNGLYYRSLRGSIPRALARAAFFSIGYLAVLYLLPAIGGLARMDLFMSMTIAFPMVAVTMSLLGAGLRQAGRYQQQLGEARDIARMNHRRLAEAEHVARVGSWEWDADDDVAVYSDGYLAIVGGDHFEPTLEGWMSIIHPDDRVRALRATQEALEHVGETVEVEYRVVLPSRDTRVTLSRARAVVDAGGGNRRLMGTIQDITDLRALGSELAHHQELSDMKSRFLSTVSHELRTPLTSLIGFTEAMLIDDYDRPTQIEFLTLMQEQGMELAALIDDLITFGRVEAGELTLESATVNLGAEVQRVVSGLASKGSSILVQIEERVELQGDPLRVRQIVRNLLDNALKYGDSPIRVHAFRRDSQVVCRVSDGGPGIDQENLDLVFEPYRRLIDDRTMGLPGVGLGLPLCRLLAERHHGTLDYLDNGGGATFELALPAAGP